jgi:hypothetical protein
MQNMKRANNPKTRPEPRRSFAFCGFRCLSVASWTTKQSFMAPRSAGLHLVHRVECRSLHCTSSAASRQFNCSPAIKFLSEPIRARSLRVSKRNLAFPAREMFSARTMRNFSASRLNEQTKKRFRVPRSTASRSVLWLLTPRVDLPGFQ